MKTKVAAPPKKRNKKLPNVSQVKYGKLKHIAMVITDRTVPHAENYLQNTYLLGRGSVVARALPESRVIIPDSPAMLPNEIFVRWLDAGGTQWMGHLSGKTKFLKTPERACKTVPVPFVADWRSSQLQAWDARRLIRLKKYTVRKVEAAKHTAAMSGSSVRRASRFSIPDRPLTKDARMSTKTKKGTKSTTAKKASPKTAAPDKKAKAAAPSKRYDGFAGKTLIRLGDAIKTNPRREGSPGFKNWAKIKKGMTFEQYLAAGGEFGKLKTEIKRRNLRLK